MMFSHFPEVIMVYYGVLEPLDEFTGCIAVSCVLFLVGPSTRPSGNCTAGPCCGATHCMETALPRWAPERC